MLKQIILSLTLTFFLFSTNHAQQVKTINISDDIQLYYLGDSIFVHTTWHEMPDFGRIPSNGLIIIKGGEAIMIDTPMDNEKTKTLTEFLEDSLHVKLQKLIIGHYHNDCLGGLPYLQNKNIESIANQLTIEKCKELNLPLPSIAFKDSLDINFNGKHLVCKYFGAGHTIDNIVVWIPENKILFGGCIVKSLNSRNLGYSEESVIPEWDKTIEKILKTYPEIETVIPGHGRFGGMELLNHTIKLVQNEKNKSEQET